MWVPPGLPQHLPLMSLTDSCGNFCFFLKMLVTLLSHFLFLSWEHKLVFPFPFSCFHRENINLFWSFFCSCFYSENKNLLFHCASGVFPTYGPSIYILWTAVQLSHSSCMNDLRLCLLLNTPSFTWFWIPWRNMCCQKLFSLWGRKG